MNPPLPHAPHAPRPPRTRRALTGWRAGSLLALAGWLALPALAAGGPQAAALQACRADAQTLCPATRPGDGQLLVCLQAQAAALTPACREALPALAACRETLQRLCGDAAAGQRRSCLLRHRAELGDCAPAR